MKRNWRSWPLIRHLRAMQFRRLRPLRDGEAHGTAVVRYYWARYLEQHREDVQGRGLEIGTTAALKKYGGPALTQAEALDITGHSDEVKIVADLSRADHVPSDLYDCFIIQFATAVIYDIDAALYHAVRILKPGGVLLVNFWCTDFYFDQGYDMGTGSPLYFYYYFTPIQVENMLRNLGLQADDFEITVYGNLLTRMSFLMNLPAEELTQDELDHVDPGHPLLICARIVKAEDAQLRKPVYRDEPWTPDGVPLKSGSKTTKYGDHYQRPRPAGANS